MKTTSIRNLGALLGMLALAGCYSAPANTLEGRCERAAGHDPEIEQAVQDSASELAQVRGEALIEERKLRRSFMERCMGGLGGVAPPISEYKY